ncbi:terminase large subunit [Tissierella praeacuta]|uniref:terminase large subunit n=1 Tax=Tissierella praeacuta TaxID=43131 RepID=UPI0028ADD1D3|nr:terminase TerL endonuclease subunit [Tissierella praeacuta]
MMTVSKNSLIIEPTKYPRTDPNIVFGKVKPAINKKGLKEYPSDYNPILEYWEQIKTGKTIVSKKAYQQYEEIVKWIEEDGYKEWFYSSSRANHIIEFAENYCCHSKGKMAGKKVVLELWEKAYLASVYGFIDIEGNRKHQRVVLIVGKKNGKSLLDSIMGLYGLVGDGEGGPEIYAVATKRDQAKIVWQEAKRMVKKSPALRKRIKTLSYDIISEFNDGIFKALASDADSLDGLNIHVVIMDEWHQWKNGRALYDIMADGVTARDQPLIIMTSTAGTIREDIFDEIYEEAEIQFNNMKLGNEVDDRTLFFIYELDKKSEWRDANNWIKANPGLGTIKKLRALQDKAKRVADNSRLEKNFVCKEFNIRETSSESWLTFEQLNNTDTFDIEKLKPRYGVAGIDLGATTDLTCATIIFRVPDDSILYVKQMYWLPSDLFEKRIKEDKIPYDIWLEQKLLRLSEGNKVNYKDVTQWLLEVQNEMDIYIYKIGYDNWGSTYLIDELKQNFGKTVVELVVQGAKTFSSPMKRFESDLEAKKINYDNNPILKWNLSNAAIKTDSNDNIALVKTSNPRRRIDGVASLLDAFIVLENHYEDYMNMI